MNRLLETYATKEIMVETGSEIAGYIKLSSM